MGEGSGGRGERVGGWGVGWREEGGCQHILQVSQFTGLVCTSNVIVMIHVI